MFTEGIILLPSGVATASAARPRISPGALIAVFIGGSLGVALRIVFDFIFGLLNPQASYLGTLLINASGSFLLGIFVAGIWAKTAEKSLMRIAIGPGFLGGFTTLSGVMLYTLYVPGPLLAFAYLFGSLATSTLAAWAGLSLLRGKKPRARQRGKK